MQLLLVLFISEAAMDCILVHLEQAATHCTCNRLELLLLGLVVLLPCFRPFPLCRSVYGLGCYQAGLIHVASCLMV